MFSQGSDMRGLTGEGFGLACKDAAGLAFKRKLQALWVSILSPTP